QLRTLTLDGRPMMRVRREGSDIMTGCGIFEKVAGDPTLDGEGCAAVPFLSLFYLAEGVKSGMHHPDGIFWVRRPDRRHQVFTEKVPLISVAPTLLAMQDVAVPPTMRGPILEAAVGSGTAVLAGA
ncbi:MAG: hypothetical protein KC485_10680, partial [Gemmatimonadetes bacterium]|nr:hypothetical protein [Gemmatimonadota bacterium]